MEEIWVPVIDFPKYEVSNFGNVANRETGRILKKSLNYKGYEQVCLSEHGCRYVKNVHQLVAEAFLEEPSDKTHNYVVAHSDDDRTNNYADNLEYITKAEAAQRAFHRGKRSGHMMRPIRCIETGEKYKSIIECSREMGISVQAISRCVNNEFLSTKDGYHFESIY